MLTKKQYIGGGGGGGGGLPEKEVSWSVCRFKGGDLARTRGVLFLRGVLITQCTICCICPGKVISLIFTPFLVLLIITRSGH